MGVDVQAFVIFGVKLPGDAIKDGAYEQLEPFMYGPDVPGTIKVVYDGMSGQYVVVGKLLAASEQTDGHFEEPVKVPLALPTAEYLAVESKIRELFPDQPSQPLSVIVVSHYH